MRPFQLCNHHPLLEEEQLVTPTDELEEDTDVVDKSACVLEDELLDEELYSELDELEDDTDVVDFELELDSSLALDVELELEELVIPCEVEELVLLPTLELDELLELVLLPAVELELELDLLEVDFCAVELDELEFDELELLLEVDSPAVELDDELDLLDVLFPAVELDRLDSLELDKPAVELEDDFEDVLELALEAVLALEVESTADELEELDSPSARRYVSVNSRYCTVVVPVDESPFMAPFHSLSASNVYESPTVPAAASLIPALVLETVPVPSLIHAA